MPALTVADALRLAVNVLKDAAESAECHLVSNWISPRLVCTLMRLRRWSRR